jgi:AraC-like DNA-binding protein
VRGSPIYREFAPRAALVEFVHVIWTFSAPHDETPQPIAPDGRSELIVHCGNPYREHGVVEVQPRVLFAGQLTKPLTLVAHGDIAVVGVRFWPDGARAFLGRSVDAATDRRLDLAVLHGEAAVNLGQAVRAIKDLREAAELAEDYVETRLAGAHIDAIVREAVTRLLAGQGTRTPAGVSERQFQRRFKAEVGVNPRTLQTILRFRRVFDAIEHPEISGWVEAALTAGYFDQPQMARDFRRFLGCTAREWAAQRAGLAQALTASGQVRDPVSDAYKKDKPASG